MTDWHRWFAWRPCSAGWLRWVERRHTGQLHPDAIAACHADYDGYWVYRRCE